MRTILILAVLAVACTDEKKSSEPEAQQPKKERVPPSYVTVEHILIAVPHDPRMKHIKRTTEESKQLVDDIVAQLDDGADFEKLKQQYSDDRQPGKGAGGPYAMANRGMNPGKAFPRDDMVPAFGDVSFSLEVGEIGVAEFDPAKSKYGFHIVKRVK